MVREIKLGQGEQKGKLIKFSRLVIHVKCLNVTGDPEKQDEICQNCFWHNHPYRTQGYALHCRMY